MGRVYLVGAYNIFVYYLSSYPHMKGRGSDSMTTAFPKPKVPGKATKMDLIIKINLDSGHYL